MMATSTNASPTVDSSNWLAMASSFDILSLKNAVDATRVTFLTALAAERILADKRVSSVFARTDPDAVAAYNAAVDATNSAGNDTCNAAAVYAYRVSSDAGDARVVSSFRAFEAARAASHAAHADKYVLLQ